jgi:DNA-binding response OmpR family regulator
MGRVKHVLVADDDAELRSTVAETLEWDGAFVVSQAATAADTAAVATARDGRLDALLLDVRLPDEDGRDLCARLRRHGVRVPILMLTGSGAEDDVVRGLDAGANDYIVKPFRIAELLARLRAQLRAHETSDDAELKIGPYQFRPATRLLQHPADNRGIRLTDKEAAVLKFLYRAGDQPVGRKVLLREVWGYNAGADTHTVETHIYRLRRKIEPDPRAIRLLVNVGGGYRLQSGPLAPLYENDRSGRAHQPASASA